MIRMNVNNNFNNWMESTINDAQVESATAATVADSSSEDETAGLSFSAYDPANYANVRIDDTVISTLMSQPYHPPEGFSFPISNGRHCSHEVFCHKLPDNTTQQRK